MENTGVKKSNVFFFEDFSSKDLNENRVGRKGLSLFQLKDMDVPVPDFFVISSKVFLDFCVKALASEEKKLLEKGRNPEGEEIELALLKNNFDKEVEDEILSAYTRLSGFSDAWVSVRSSVVFPENKEISFSGIFSTELNVRHFADLLGAVKRIYASLFTDDVVAYASKMDVDLSEVKLSVVVQKMVQSEISGVVFTIDPITQDESKLSIEAVYGLGDVISLGEITPDSYTLNKRDLSIVEKHIAPQEWMKVRTMNKGRGARNNEEKIKISNAWSHRQKLNDKDMQEISKIALIIENKSREVQNVEWVISGGKVWILQNKPLFGEHRDRIVVGDMSLAKRSLREVIVALLERYRGEEMLLTQAMSEAQRIVQRNSNEVGSKFEKLVGIAKRKTEEVKENKTERSDFILSGIGASFGVAIGKITVVDEFVNKQFNNKDILLVKKYSSEMESMIISCGGIIMETGGLTSDTAILCRECKIPAIVGAQGASDILKNGDLVRVDGNAGSIYREVEQKDETVHPVVEAYSEGNVVSVDLLEKKEEIKIEEEKPSIQIPRDNTLSPSATKVFSMCTLPAKDMLDKVGNSNGIVYIDLDEIMLAEGRHILSHVEQKKFVDYSTKISEKILEYVELAQGDEVILSIGSATVGKFKALVGGKEFENNALADEVFGGTHYINNLEMFRRVLKIVKRIRNIYKKRNVSLGIHAPMNEDIMKDLKKVLLGEKLRRSSSFSIYAILDNPSEVILADEIVATKIDGLILNMPRIVKHMQGIKLDAKNAKYDLGRNSVFKIVENILEVVKNKEAKIIAVVEDSNPLLRFCIQSGVYGVAVLPEDIVDARKAVSEEETKLILGK